MANKKSGFPSILLLMAVYSFCLFLIAPQAQGVPQSLEALQDSFLTLKYGAFLHFNMGTFTDEEWATPGQNSSTFNPTNLDCGQWADAAVAAGMKYMTLTTKHHDGFCLWNSAYKTYDVGSSSWKAGNGDVVREFVDSMRSRSIKVCFYYSIWDKTDGNDTAFIKNQLTELLTNYGPIEALWFDGWGWRVGYSSVPYQTIRNHIKSIQPNCLVFENNHQHSLSNSEMIIYERNIDGIPSSTNTLPVEVCDNIRSDGSWFYHLNGNCSLKSVDNLYASLTGINKGNGNYLLDLTPDRTGNIPQCQIDRLKELATRIQDTTYVSDTSLCNQDKAVYYGTWSVLTNRGFGDYIDDLVFTRTPNDSFVFTFNGTGVDLIAELHKEHGAFDIYLDGTFIRNIDLTAPVGTRSAQQVVFSVQNLALGAHHLKGVYTSGTDKYGVVDAFHIYTAATKTEKSSQSMAIPESLKFMVVNSCGIIHLPTNKSDKPFALYSIQGKKIATLKTGIGGTVRIPNLASGIYIVKQSGTRSQFLRRIMVLR